MMKSLITSFPSALLLFLGSLLVSAGEESSHPNVLFIAVDDLRPAIASYGDPLAVTPNLDRLAARSVQFERAYCQVAVCNPSRATLMTGLRPDKLGVWTLPIHFREAMPDAVTMPQWFRKFGYTAVSHGKIYHNPTPDPQSWSEPIRRLPQLPFPYPEGTREKIRAAAAELPINDWRKKSLRPPATAAPELADELLMDGARTSMAIEDLRRLGAEEEPFFLAMGYIRPHLAWVAPKKYWDLYDPADLPVLTDEVITPDTPAYALHNNSELSHYMDLIDFPRPWEDRTIPEEKARQLVHGYYACVSYIDAQIGRLLDALDEEGLSEDTIIVLWSDHGWKLGEYRGWGKMTNYEIDARVPLMIATPGMKTTGEKSYQLAELLDLYPTLCELAGIEVPDFVDGKSLAPILQDVEAEVHDGAVNQYYRRWQGEEYMGYSLRTKDYRFMDWREFETGEVVSRELYDHRSEHSEKENIIAAASPELLEELTSILLKTHPRRGLEMMPTVHSNPTKRPHPIEVSFRNEADTELLIYELSSKGKRGRANRLAAGERVSLSSYLGAALVVESVCGRVHEVHYAALPAREVVVGIPQEQAVSSES
ncbi:MAG: sulfatase [Verrucomicrobiota bacterium JB023]|nr:sulfatase [Verrucomicrobiota bacterium JB023]